MGREFPEMDDEFELSLELSIGGCYARSAAGSLEGEVKGTVAAEGGGGGDLRRRREVQAMKRREARMKMEFKKSRGAAAEEPVAKREKRSCDAAFACPLMAAGEGGGEEAPAASSSERRSSSYHRSTSHKGGSSSDTGSHSSSIRQYQNDKVEINSSSPRSEPPRRCQDPSTKGEAGQPPQSDAGEGSLTAPICSTAEKPSPSAIINPPPKGPRPGQECGPLPLQMPCVSATGNGPSGQTITGFLCKYTKSKVSIVCACHRRLFSPAEFVEHAGGVDVTHPLRHITVVPAALR
ncbi:ninja-family protein AFP2-like [Salvia divinorum]|uniref:Ninja-family protein n=1 Tax=Salvia divinorum TaxID=28513 RepID=A0ABD1HM55_SALDI